MKVISTILLTATVASGTSVSQRKSGGGLRGLQQSFFPDSGYCTGNGMAREGSEEHLAGIAMTGETIFIRNTVSDRYIAADQSFLPTPYNAEDIAAIPLDLETKLDWFASSKARWTLTEVSCPFNHVCPPETRPCYAIESEHFNGDTWRLSARDTVFVPGSDYVTGTEPRLIDDASDTSVLDHEKWQIVPRECAGSAETSSGPCYHIVNVANGRRWYSQPDPVRGTFGAVYWETAQLYTDQLWELIPTSTVTTLPTSAPTANPCTARVGGELQVFCAIHNFCIVPSLFDAYCVP